jgi:hypothetical protein
MNLDELLAGYRTYLVVHGFDASPIDAALERK